MGGVEFEEEVEEEVDVAEEKVGVDENEREKEIVFVAIAEMRGKILRSRSIWYLLN